MVALLLVFGYSTLLKFMYPNKYEDIVTKYAVEYNVDKYLVLAIIKAESGFDPNATSMKNAKGLMQIIDNTGIWIANKIGIKDFKVKDLYDPETNIRMGCWYLDHLYKDKKIKGNYRYVIVAYNAGYGNLLEWLSDKRYINANGELKIIPFGETEEYLKRVEKYYLNYKSIYEKEGIS